jgi:flagellar hook-length control protein FliK
MAITDFSTLLFTEQDSSSVFKNNGLPGFSDDSGSDFLSQLENANIDISVTKKSGNGAFIKLPKQGDEAAANHISPELPPQTNGAPAKIDDELESNVLSQDERFTGDDMLAHINAAQTINTSITTPSTNNLSYESGFNILDTQTSDTLEVINFNPEHVIPIIVPVPQTTNVTTHVVANEEAIEQGEIPYAIEDKNIQATTQPGDAHIELPKNANSDNITNPAVPPLPLNSIVISEEEGSVLSSEVEVIVGSLSTRNEIRSKLEVGNIELPKNGQANTLNTSTAADSVDNIDLDSGIDVTKADSSKGGVDFTALNIIKPVASEVYAEPGNQRVTVSQSQVNDTHTKAELELGKIELPKTGASQSNITTPNSPLTSIGGQSELADSYLGKPTTLTTNPPLTSAIEQDEGAFLASTIEQSNLASKINVANTTATAQTTVNMPVSKLNSEQLEAVEKAVINLVVSDSDAIKSDKVLSSLTTEQLNQVNTQLESMSDAKNSTKVVTIKDMLSSFVEQNNQPETDADLSGNTAVGDTDINEELTTLTTTQKHALVEQLNVFVKTQQPQSQQLTHVKSAIAQLEVNLNTESAVTTEPVDDFITTDKSVLSSLASTPLFSARTASSQVNGITTKVSESNSTVKVNNAVEGSFQDAIDLESIQPDEITQEVLKIKRDGTEETTRIAQLFNRLTRDENTLQGAENLSEYESQLVDTQVLQHQQLQSTTATKQVNVDPASLQALNIIKSDAAKMLQERVSSMLSLNNKEAEIRLDPPEMGSMQIRVRSDAEQAQINFVVQNQQAKEALEQSMPKLREMLAQQGIELGESNISQGQSGSEHTEQGSSNGQGRLANQASTPDENNEQSEKSSQSTRQQTSSSIDYYA